VLGADSPPLAGETPRYLVPSEPIEGLPVLMSARGGPAGVISGPALAAMVEAFIAARWTGLLSGIALCEALGRLGPEASGAVRGARIALLRNLFQRAIRSVPLEPLADWILRPPAEVTDFTAHRYAVAINTFGAGLDDARLMIERWISAIELQGVKPEEEALATALGALIGCTGNPDVLLAQSPFLGAVISATRPAGVGLQVTNGTMDLATRRLAQVAIDLEGRRLDIPLFPPLSGATPRHQPGPLQKSQATYAW
jgi:hypothetical protein